LQGDAENIGHGAYDWRLRRIGKGILDSVLETLIPEIWRGSGHENEIDRKTHVIDTISGFVFESSDKKP
jgi:hypothetical protein